MHILGRSLWQPACAAPLSTCATLHLHCNSVTASLACRGTLHIEAPGKKALPDTYMHTSNFGRGYAWVNGHNLGRFWTEAGPQQALYIPGTWLKPGDNEIVVLEIQISVDSPRVTFADKPDFSGGRLSQQGTRMLGGLLAGFWHSMHNRGNERFFMLDVLKRSFGIL